MSPGSGIGDAGRELAMKVAEMEETGGIEGVNEGLQCVNELAKDDEDTERLLLDPAITEVGSKVEGAFLERERLRALEIEDSSATKFPG